ncbi:MAG: mechanosensitive ion channel [Lachnospiraceae bacterium]|nr:mechanosensitive ion channel [Lachnospiraceae bacterium]
MSEIWPKLAEWAMEKGVKILIALVILFVGFKIVNWIAKKVEKKLLEKGKLDQTLVHTLVYIGKILVKVIIGVCLVGYLGVETSSISALIASLGLAAGLALNGALANFAGGMIIIVTRPFKIGDFISAQGVDGTVEEIRIINTKIVTLDNRVVYLPNGALSSGNIVNLTEKDLRRVDLDFSVAGNDPELVKKLILETCEKNELILQDPAPFARITDFGAGNGTKVTVRAWTKSGTYWDVYLGLLEEVKKVFDENGVVIPFNQLDVHIKND